MRACIRACVLIAGTALYPMAHTARASDVPTVKSLTAANNHTCALFSDGSLKCWGTNDYGELGQGDTTYRGGTAGTMGAGLKPIDLGKGRKAVAIGLGYSFTCALLDNAKVKCWGANDSGQLGQGDTTNRGDQAGSMGDALPYIDLGKNVTVQAIAVGGSHVCALLGDQSVKCWGANESGQLFTGDSTSRGDQAGSMGDTLAAINLGKGPKPQALQSNGSNTCAVLADNSLKCWGNNDSGQLGLGDFNYRGNDPSTIGDALPAIDLGGLKVMQLTVGGQTDCVILSDQSVRCWGRNDSGQLGDATFNNRGAQPNQMGAALPAMDLAAGLPVKEVRCGTDAQCCARFENNAIKCWGRNDVGELGLEDFIDRGSTAGDMGDSLPFVDLGHLAIVEQVTIGTQHMCAVLSGGKVKCWGTSQSSQLGYEDQLDRGGKVGDMGDKLPFVSL